MATLTGHTKSGGQPSGALRCIELDVAMDDSYPTGGETITALGALLDGYTIVACVADVVDVGGTSRKFKVNKTTKKVQAFTLDDAEVADLTDLALYTSVKPIIWVE